jgi:hypothetical protein
MHPLCYRQIHTTADYYKYLFFSKYNDTVELPAHYSSHAAEACKFQEGFAYNKQTLNDWRFFGHHLALKYSSTHFI